jgi:DNA-binding response OmpR family regulator
VASTDDSAPVVLVVDDEQDVADTYALRLQKTYETRVAYGGEAALTMIDDDVDAVLLDRRMPDISGDDVLAEIRERGYDCAVIMATAVDPDLNILEMDFDDYLCKPIFQETLLETLEKHVDESPDDSEDMAEFLSLISKIDVLKAELSEAELAASDEYQRLQERVDALAPTLRESVEDFDEMLETHREIDRQS